MKEAILLTDGYKLDHRRQYPENTEYVYSNWTPRSCHYYPEATEGAVVFGIQYFIKEYLMKQFQQDFFNKPKDVAVAEFKRRVDTFLGPNNVGTKHIEELHDLGYLPIRIKALPEGTLCPIRVPALTFINTHPDFFWLTNYFETLISTTLWLPMTSATTARLYKKELIRHARKTGFKDVDLNFLVHDFSMRGMAGVEAAIMSGMGHMTSFCGSETIPAIAGLEEYYNANAGEELIAATNLVLGVGSYTYQYKSRDSLGFAMKATWCQVNGEGREIFKDPKTDDGTKKSLKGLICVQSDGDRYIAEDQVTKEQEDKSCLQTVFEDGKLVKEWSLRQIRDNVNNSIVLED